MRYPAPMPQDMTHSAIVFPVRAGRVALAERLPGTRMAGAYSPPGGGIDPGDASVRATARREMEEETGLVVPEERFLYLGKLTATGEDWQPVGGHFFLLPLEEGEELKDTEPDQHGPWKWYTFAEAARLPLPPVSQPLLLLLAHAATPV